MSLQARRATMTIESISIRDFAQRHGISVRTVYTEISEGRLVARKCRDRTIINAEDERAWLASLPKIKPASAAA
jgi:hypothetical protein